MAKFDLGNLPDLARLLSSVGEAQSRIEQVRALGFPAQLKFLDDPRRLKCALCTRRAGKSFTVGLDMFCEHALYPGASSLYIGLTRESAKRTMFKDIVDVIDDKLDWGLTLNKSELSYRSPNGATTYFLGLDTDKRQMQKTLGQKYRKVWIDEAASYTIDLRKLVFTTLWPAMRDHRGTICMLGTPGDYLQIGGEDHLFYAATTGRDARWSAHRWTAADNPHIRDEYLRELAYIREHEPLRMETPGYRQMELGEWVIDGSGYVYRFQESRNTIPSGDVPTLERHTISIDLGWNDATAFCVGGWRSQDPNLYILRAWKKTEMTLTEVAGHIKDLRRRYPTAKLVVDAAAKQSVMELAQRIGEPLHPTEKAGKSDAIRAMNSDMIEAKVKVVASECQDLISEWKSLVWDERAASRVEDPRCKNDCCDSALYLHRNARPYLTLDAPSGPKTEQQRMDEWADAQWARRNDPDWEPDEDD